MGRWPAVLGSIVASQLWLSKVTANKSRRTHCLQEGRASKDSTGGVPEALSFARLRTASVFVAERSLPANQLKEEDVVFVGSAFCFAQRSLVTCAHLFQGPARHGLLLRFGDGRWAAAELRGSCAAVDVAVLKLSDDEPEVCPLTFSQSLPRQGERVVVCGMTQHGQEAVGLSGLVSQPRQRFRGLPEEPTTHFVQLALPTLPGMSGSPVLNAEGKVCAMVAKKFEEHGLAIPAERVLPVALCLEAGYAWRLPMLGMEVKAGGTLLQPRVVVKAFPAGSAAERAGVEVGDEIISINGAAVATLLEMREALLQLGDPRRDAAAATVPVLLRLRRGQGLQLLDLEVHAPRAPKGAQDVSIQE